MTCLIQRISAVVLSAVLLTGAVSVPAQAADVSNFQDVSQTDYYAQFSPAATIPRAQAMTFLWRAAGSQAESTTEQTSTEQEAHTTDPDVQTSETAA